VDPVALRFISQLKQFPQTCERGLKLLAGCVIYSFNLENGGSKDVQKFGNTAYTCRMPSPRNMIYISNEIQFLETVLGKM